MKNEINPMQTDDGVCYPFLQSPRCQARTRRGMVCKSPAVTHRNVCRMHGGAKGSGAPKGSQNALKHGLTTKTAKQMRKAVRKCINGLKQLI